VKPFRGKRRGPQVRSSDSARRVRGVRVVDIRKESGASVPRGGVCIFGGRSATTGSSAFRNPRRRCPILRGSVLQLRAVLARRWTDEDRSCAVGVSSGDPFVRSTCGDYRQCQSASTRGRWRIGRSPVRPVLKHGPRSLTCARVSGCYET